MQIKLYLANHIRFIPERELSVSGKCLFKLIRNIKDSGNSEYECYVSISPQCTITSHVQQNYECASVCIYARPAAVRAAAWNNSCGILNWSLTRRIAEIACCKMHAAVRGAQYELEELSQ
ncbi:hypothetical protein AVEN_21236-1 [Araneus ventricosus]|uniref:Uncharacterized protein n=1 Tax=Araneus ventricosus TaxID=182803 RepID=A0A4Y2GG31_ARAVE|nr:hypothetical protein AVEN_21236-1 [Araneus ventricosus]